MPDFILLLSCHSLLFILPILSDNVNGDKNGNIFLSIIPQRYIMSNNSVPDVDISIRSLQLSAPYLISGPAMDDIIKPGNLTNENDVLCVNASLSDCESIVSEYRNDHWFSPPMEAMLIFFYSSVMLLGILGNSLVCYVVIKFKHLQQSRNILILNLAICGIIMCAAAMPFSLVRLTLKNWPLGDVMCRISPTLQTIDVFVSTFTIVAIAIDR